MTELVEIRLDSQSLVLNNNIVKGAVIPNTTSDLDRDLAVQGQSVIEGAVYARSFDVTKGPLNVFGPVFTQRELHIYSDVAEPVLFQKCVGSAGSVIAHSRTGRSYFGADVNAKSLNLRNAYVAANLFAEDIVLENCVVLGGVFATKSLAMADVVVGTFNSPSVQAGKSIHLLLPSTFSVEPIAFLPGTRFVNHTLTDLSALMRGVPERERTGAIPLDPQKEEQRTTLVDDKGNTQVLRSLSVVNKVLAADLLDLDRLQNHFLLKAGSLGAQLLKSYSIGANAQGKPVVLNPVTLAEFFFRILDGRIVPQWLSAEFTMDELMKVYRAE